MSSQQSDPNPQQGLGPKTQQLWQQEHPSPLPSTAHSSTDSSDFENTPLHDHDHHEEEDASYLFSSNKMIDTICTAASLYIATTRDLRTMPLSTFFSMDDSHEQQTILNFAGDHIPSTPAVDTDLLIEILASVDQDLAAHHVMESAAMVDVLDRTARLVQYFSYVLDCAREREMEIEMQDDEGMRDADEGAYEDGWGGDGLGRLVHRRWRHIREGR